MLNRAVKTILFLIDLVGTGIIIGLSLLPLSALLLAYPAFNSQESVLSDTVSGKRSWLIRQFSRLFALIGSLIVTLTLIAVSVEIVSRLPLPEKGSFGVIAETVMPAPGSFMGPTEEQREKAISQMPSNVQELMRTPLYKKLPPAMIEHWPFVLLLVYGLDVLVLLTIGKVPLAYNIRNLRVRWITNGMTVFAFVFVIGLLAFLLAFVNGLNNLTANTGVPGNVFVLSDGSTDEILSNLGYGDLDNVERIVVNEEQVLDSTDKPKLDAEGKEVWRACPPERVKMQEFDGKKKYLASRETFYSVNQPIPNSNPPRRRFISMRSHDDPQVAGAVHNIDLQPGSRWFNDTGVDQKSRIECVLGEGIAGTLGDEQKKPRLEVGDTFVLGEMTWVVVGIMKSEGTTFGSEIWVKRFSRIYKPFGKEKYTTLVMRTESGTKEAARLMATYLSKRYDQQKLKAFSEPDYYAELAKANNQFLVAVVIVAIVMAIGGIFGMMTTMLASVAQRIRDIGVLRLLGFKRWQVTISFLLESLMIALIGAIIGCVIAWLVADGRETTGNLASRNGPGGKRLALKIEVDAEVWAMSLCFALVMGRIGGLVPAMSAMRVKILDSLK